MKSGNFRRHLIFSSIIKAAIPTPHPTRFEFLEVGVWAGWSTASWIKSLGKARLNFHITVIDSWDPGYSREEVSSNDQYRAMNELATVGSIETTFRWNIANLLHPHEVTILKGESDKILHTLPAQYFDLISIDGDHLYEQVKKDLIAAIPLLKSTGV